MARRKFNAFSTYVTKHSVAPPECNITDEQSAWLLKANAPCSELGRIATSPLKLLDRTANRSWYLISGSIFPPRYFSLKGKGFSGAS